MGPPGLGFAPRLGAPGLVAAGSLRFLKSGLALLRWDKPSGRLILLIPAGWSLWLLPTSPPDPLLVALIGLGGLAVSGAGCVANDLWDRRIDPLVERTRTRPLASGAIGVTPALGLLLLCLVLALGVVLALPAASRGLCLLLAMAALPPILLYPSAKRWFALPQLVLALCWGFAVLIPWAAAQANLAGGWPLALAWLATLLWCFGFDTAYAMADRPDDRALGIRSSALTLGAAAPAAIGVCYALAALALALAARLAGVSPWFWPAWGLAAAGMVRGAWQLRLPQLPRSAYGRHFSQQVWLGALLLLALVLGRWP